MRILRIGIAIVWMAVLGGNVWAVGPLVRVPNTTLKLPLEPGGAGLVATPAWGGLTFANPVALVTPPGETGRVFIVERGGRIAVVTNLAAPTRRVFLDLKDRVRLDGFNEMGLLGLAFHPGYSTNGRLFVFYTTTASTAGRPNDRHNRLSEFRVDPPAASVADPSTERILIQQADDLVNHNGGDLHFGPDGYLYVSLGDEGGGDDSGNNGQRIDKDFFSGILRLDVDERPGNLIPNSHPAVVGGYRVPADNPFVGATQFNGRAVVATAVRTEFWSVGLRNPWRMSFDRLTGELWVGEVGQNQREGVVIAGRGSNHGWPFRELNIAGPRSRLMPAGFLSDPAFRHVPPVWSYAHGSGANQGNSIIGGRVYRGARLASLYGAYVFADYVSGNVWALRRGPDGPAVTRLLGVSGLSAFGEDPGNGDLLMADHEGGRILRLDRASTPGGTALPARLSSTGAFADLATLTPHPGIVPYDVNVPFWSDGAIKRRWFSIPDLSGRFRHDPVKAWWAPTGAVWIKHFEIEMQEGDAATRRRLETRFLVRNASGVHGFTYRWNAAQTDAELVGEFGADETLERVVDGAPSSQQWHYPGRAECQFCHNPAAGLTLSFNTAQLQRSFENGGATTNFVAALAGAGYFSNVPEAIHTARTLAAGTDETASLSWRARSWLAANCASCHLPGGPGGGRFDARIGTDLDASGMLNGALIGGSVDAADRVIVPGDVEHSVLLRRLSTRGVGQMPPLATDRVDPSGASLVRRWIESLATPPPTLAEVRLNVEVMGAKLVVRANQPADRAVRIESTRFPIDRPVWTPVEAPGNEFFVPATDRELELELDLPESEGALFRAVVLDP